jgi:hypothetical protein
MPNPPVHPVKPLREYLFQPLHDLRKLEPVRRQNVERQPVILKLQCTDFKLIPPFRLPEHPGEQRKSVSAPEQGLPIIDTSTYFVPNVLAK